MSAFTNLMKKMLRFPADALIASSRSFPDRVEECLRASPALHELLEARLAATCNGKEPAASNGVASDAEEGTLPYMHFVEEAERLGMDVNDYLEHKLEWGDVRALLERSVFPFLRPDSIVCELGAGTGRWSREILKEIPQGQLHLVDYSPWFVQFQTRYFGDDPRVAIHQTNGFALPIEESDWIDVCCSFGTFIMMKLGNIYRYAREFRRVLKPGGHFVIEYIDIETPEGWDWLVTQSSGENEAGCFTYYTPAILKHVFEDAGLEVLRDDHVGKWHTQYPYRWLIGRRPD